MSVVSLRKLFGILVAVAVLLAPAFTRAGEAFAALPVHHMQMTESGHCTSPPSDQDDRASQSCCIAVCAALAVAPFTPAQSEPPRQIQAATFVPSAHVAYLREIATPPPRLA